jgi:hypothetical protein
LEIGKGGSLTVNPAMGIKKCSIHIITVAKIPIIKDERIQKTVMFDVLAIYKK